MFHLMPFSTGTPLVVLLLTTVLSLAGGANALGAWHEGFETPQTSWRDAGGDARYRILKHQRLQGDAHSGKGCEWLRLEGRGGSHVYVAHDVGRPPVIDELAPSAWVKSDRPGPQLYARIVLPRTIDKRTGRAVAAIIAGGAYTAVGRWQQLRLDGIPRLLTRQIHVLRMQLGPQVDGREAYLDAVLLNVYSGPGETNVWIDDLEVAGHVALGRERTVAPPAAAETWASLGIVRLPPPDQKKPPGPRRSVKLVGGVLLVDDRPMFPRVVQHCGEPLAAL
ncbi:MAG: hypothetical protein KKE86_15185, partial [Planctomycetes bacterium]|nr:hypothetical protein [Planctomycetota bacterium]